MKSCRCLLHASMKTFKKLFSRRRSLKEFHFPWLPYFKLLFETCFLPFSLALNGVAVVKLWSSSVEGGEQLGRTNSQTIWNVSVNVRTRSYVTFGPWWWSSGLLWRSVFESRWSLQFFYLKLCLKRTKINKKDAGVGPFLKKKLLVFPELISVPLWLILFLILLPW